MDKKIKVLTKDQSILTISTPFAIRFGKLKKMLEKHEGSLVNATFDMQLITTKALEALINCIEKRDLFLKCRRDGQELPEDLTGSHGLCVKVDVDTLTDILEVYDEIDLDCQLNVSQNSYGACIDLEYETYFCYEEK